MKRKAATIFCFKKAINYNALSSILLFNPWPVSRGSHLREMKWRRSISVTIPTRVSFASSDSSESTPQQTHLKGLGHEIEFNFFDKLGLTKNLYCFKTFKIVLWKAIVFAIFPVAVNTLRYYFEQFSTSIQWVSVYTVDKFLRAA